MDAFGWFITFDLVSLALCVIVPVFQAGSKARKKAAQEREQAEKELQALEARRRAEERARAQRAEKEREAAQKAQEREAARAAKEAARQKRQAEKLEAARQLAEYKERALQAEKELQALRKAPAQDQQPQEAPQAEEQPQAAPEAPQEAHAQQAEETPQEQPAALSLAQFARQNAPQPFAGEVVAFTGTLPAMKRGEAIQATAQRGGRAYDTVNTQCTLLVVGVKPGSFQLDRARRWNVKTITWEEWYDRAGISYRRRLAALNMARRATV